MVGYGGSKLLICLELILQGGAIAADHLQLRSSHLPLGWLPAAALQLSFCRASPPWARTGVGS